MRFRKYNARPKLVSEAVKNLQAATKAIFDKRVADELQHMRKEINRAVELGTFRMNFHTSPEREAAADILEGEGFNIHRTNARTILVSWD
jgi:hypothetical protein